MFLIVSILINKIKQDYEQRELCLKGGRLAEEPVLDDDNGHLSSLLVDCSGFVFLGCSAVRSLMDTDWSLDWASGMVNRVIGDSVRDAEGLHLVLAGRPVAVVRNKMPFEQGSG